MKPYLVHEGKMWFVLVGCHIVAIVDSKDEGMERIRALPPQVERAAMSVNGVVPSDGDA